MKKTALWLIMAWLLTGCALYTSDGSVVIDPGHHDGGHRDGGYRDRGGHGGDFCPPGQAKKGKC